MEHMWPNLFKRASHPIFAGDAIWESMDIVGIEGAQTWDQAALMRYKSRRAFMEIVTHPNMRDRHRFKVAAMKKTIAYPVEPLGYFSDMRIILAMVLLITCLSIQLFFSSQDLESIQIYHPYLSQSPNTILLEERSSISIL